MITLLREFLQTFSEKTKKKVYHALVGFGSQVIETEDADSYIYYQFYRATFLWLDHSFARTWFLVPIYVPNNGIDDI